MAMEQMPGADASKTKGAVDVLSPKATPVKLPAPSSDGKPGGM